MRFLILLLYYERPILVQNAIKSLRNSTYQDFEVAVIDDCSPTPVPKNVPNATYYNTGIPDSQKVLMGSFAGALMNDILASSSSDVALFLCDDDALAPDYLEKLNQYFQSNNVPACYSHVYKFNPAFEEIEFVNNTDINKNRFTKPISALNNLDASQVAWKVELHREKNIWFEYPRTKGHDAVLYRQLDALGPTPFSGLVGQYKGCYTGQLGQFSENEIWSGKVKIDKPDILKMTKYSWKIEAIIQSYFRRGLKEEGERILKIASELFPELDGFSDKMRAGQFKSYPSELNATVPGQ